MMVAGGLLILILITAACLALAAETGHEAGAFALPVLGGCALLLLAFGYAGLLLPGVWAVLAALLAGVVLAARHKGYRALCAAISPALGLFFVLAAYFWIWYAIRQPMFTQWDEFTFWGTACKMTKSANMLHAAAPGNLSARSYFPGMMLLSYLVQAFGTDFAEWAAMAAYNWLFAAAIAAAAALPKQKWPATVLLGGCGFLLPFFFSVRNPGGIQYAYQSVMGDWPLGFAFGGALCVWFALGKGRTALVAAAVSLAFLTGIKDMGFAYALIGAAIIFVDCLVRQEKPTRKGFGHAVLAAAVCVAAIMAVFVSWSLWSQAVTGTDKNAVGQAGVSYATVVFGGLGQLFGIGRTEKFSALMHLMAEAFLGRNICLLGSGLRAVAVIAVVAAAAVWTAPKGAARRRTLTASLLLAAAFAVFYVFHLFLYNYNFAEAEALDLKDYARYIAPYYLGWLLTELCLLGQSFAESEKRPAAAVSVLGTSAILFATVLVFGNAGFGFWSSGDTLYQGRERVADVAAQFNRVLTPEDTVLVISQGDDATQWYQYCYALNANVGYGLGGDYAGEHWVSTFMNLSDPAGPQDYLYACRCTPENLVEFMQENGDGYLLIDRSDGYLETAFSPLFENGLTQDMGPTLYRLSENGTFALVAESEAPQW